MAKIEGSWSEQFTAAMLDENGPTPLYHQIYLLLRDQIRRGVLVAGSVFPGEQDLAAMFGVSRITMKRAFKELADDGLVARHRGRGTFVSEGGAIPVVISSFDNLIDSLKAMGLDTGVDLLDVSETIADPVVAARLDIETGSPVQRTIRRRRLGAEPFSYLVAFLPADIARRYRIKDLKTRPLLTILEDAGFKAVDAEQWVTAVGAPPEIASALNLQMGAAILKIERVMFDVHGRPIQFIQGYYHPERFQYHSKTDRKAVAGVSAADG